MANPTIQDLIGRVRGVLNETSPRAFFDVDQHLLGWVSTGLSETHLKMKKRLDGSRPNEGSPYWRNFFVEGAVVLVIGADDHVLPTNFDMLHTLIDPNTSIPLQPFDLGQEHILRRSVRLGVQRGSGFYNLNVKGAIRLLVFPGREGSPGDTRSLTLNYFKAMPRYKAAPEIVALPDEYCEPAVNYAIAKGLARFRDSPVEFFQAFAAGVDSIPDN